MPAPVQQPYKLVIREAIMAALFTKTHQIAVEEMTNLILRNCELQQYSHKSFAYNGQFYNIEHDAGPPVRQRLHPSMHKTMRAYLDEFGYSLESEKAKVSGYLTSMLAYSPLPGDYLPLLPAALHAVVREAVICDWSSSLSPEKITTFMTKYKPGYELIRQRMAINLIL